LEQGEPCDDANLLEGDGCTVGCELACDGMVDPETGTCYFVGSPDIEPLNAASRCAGFGGGAVPLTIRSDRERDIVNAWLEETTLTRVLAGLYADPNLRTWRSTTADQPGWSGDPPCPGCYAWWAEGEPQTTEIRRVAVMDRQDGWRWRVGSGFDRYGLVCERPRPGRPVDLCALPDCDPANTSEFVVGTRRYRVREVSATAISAQADCRDWKGNLVPLESEQEREMLTRFAHSSRFWIGLYRQSGKPWQWVDGVSTEQRPIPWSSAAIDNELAAVLGAGPMFDTRLVEAQNALTPLPYVCRRPAEM
jgi:cysteine-rich repeat protein